MKEKLIIQGSKGRLKAILQRPESEGKCPLVVLMHGFMASCRMKPISALPDLLEKEGIASLRFDFNGHGRSDGRFSEMTVLNEIEDARKVWEYVRSLDWVGKIGFLGHSQGGVVSGMLAGQLGNDAEGAPVVSALVQLAPAAVLKQDAIDGTIMGKTFDPQNIPDHVWVFFHKVGGEYFRVARNLPIYETSSQFEGPVCLIHGTEDTIVPFAYGEKYTEYYKDCVFHRIEGENHFLSRHRAQVLSTSVEFLVSKLK